MADTIKPTNKTRITTRNSMVELRAQSRLEQHLHHVVFARVEHFVAPGCVVERDHVAYQRARVDRAAFYQAGEVRYVRVDVCKADPKREIAQKRIADRKIERRRAEHADYRHCSATARRHYRGRQRALVADRLDSHVGAAPFRAIEDRLMR